MMTPLAVAAAQRSASLPPRLAPAHGRCCVEGFLSPGAPALPPFVLSKSPCSPPSDSPFARPLLAGSRSVFWPCKGEQGAPWEAALCLCRAALRPPWQPRPPRAGAPRRCSPQRTRRRARVLPSHQGRRGTYHSLSLPPPSRMAPPTPLRDATRTVLC